MITIQDMRDALKGQRRTEEAIFFFCLFWNSGPGTDLYRAMVATDFHPRLHTQKQIRNDPEIIYCHTILKDMVEKVYGRPLRESPLRLAKLETIKEGDVLICGPGRQFSCLEADWPCRVYRQHGDLGVACAEGPAGASFHPLKIGPDGYVIGFRR